MNPLNLSFLLLLTIIISFVDSQQPYIRKASTGCSNTDPSTSVFGYTCNGETPSCQSYLTFYSAPPYNTPSSISSLLSADPSHLAQLNSVPKDSIFETAKMVLVPVNCSCSGTHYQVNTTYTVKHLDLFLTIANNVFEGLSTCVAIEAQNSNRTAELLYAGNTLSIPLRCACPTKNQTDKGIKYLLSYVITWGDDISDISALFNVDTGATFVANGLSDQDSVIYPNTTLLIPLQTPPTSIQINQSPPKSLALPPQSGSGSGLGSGLPSKNKSSKAWIYAVVAGVVVAAVSLLLVYFYCLRKKKIKHRPVPVSNSVVDTPSFESIEKATPSEYSDIWDNITNFAKSINVYTYKELQSATEDFSPSYWIKGSVYRGVINGDLAAIKKKTGDVSDEINLLNKINHFNLIRLSGLCFDEGQWFLVYEFAANGSLSDWIKREKGTDKKFLNWYQRMQIALDVATGLNYLHSYTNPPHVHKDLTSSNVYLDSDLRAKIGNIGLARSAQEEGDFAMTRHIVGTKGYMAPEYLEHGLVSPKLDVYAFGVLLTEIITGREVSAKSSAEFQLPSFEGKEDDAVENLDNFVDPTLKGEYPSELAILVVKLIDSCLQKNLSARPSMHEVVQALSTIMETDLSFEYKLSVSVDK